MAANEIPAMLKVIAVISNNDRSFFIFLPPLSSQVISIIIIIIKMGNYGNTLVSF